MGLKGRCSLCFSIPGKLLLSIRASSPRRSCILTSLHPSSGSFLCKIKYQNPCHTCHHDLFPLPTTLYLLYEHLYVLLVSSPGISTLSYIGFRDQSSGCIVGGFVHFAPVLQELRIPFHVPRFW